MIEVLGQNFLEAVGFQESQGTESTRTGLRFDFIVANKFKQCGRNFLNPQL